MQEIVEKKFDIEPSEVVQFIRGHLFIWCHTILSCCEKLEMEILASSIRFLEEYLLFVIEYLKALPGCLD